MCCPGDEWERPTPPRSANACQDSEWRMEACRRLTLGTTSLLQAAMLWPFAGYVPKKTSARGASSFPAFRSAVAVSLDNKELQQQSQLLPHCLSLSICVSPALHLALLPGTYDQPTVLKNKGLTLWRLCSHSAAPQGTQWQLQR